MTNNDTQSPGILTLEVTLADLNVTLQVTIEGDQWVAAIAEFNQKGEPTGHSVLTDVTSVPPALVATVPAHNEENVPPWNSAQIRAVYQANPNYGAAPNEG